MPKTKPHFNPNYIHHNNTFITSIIRELVFGMEDGMVSTMGAITGIAVGTGNHNIVILSGLVIIAVESISMAVGTYVSSKSEKEVNIKILDEEKDEIKKFPEIETKEMEEYFEEDGWSKKLSKEMAKEASQNPKLMLKEMAYRELGIFPKQEKKSPFKGGVVMLFSYIFGGMVPLLAYFLTDIPMATWISIASTLSGLFILGSYTSKFTKRNWFKAGLEMLILAGLAGLVGYVVGVAFA